MKVTMSEEGEKKKVKSSGETQKWGGEKNKDKGNEQEIRKKSQVTYIAYKECKMRPPPKKRKQIARMAAWSHVFKLKAKIQAKAKIPN